jgi:hypothetical protein
MTEMTEHRVARKARGLSSRYPGQANLMTRPIVIRSATATTKLAGACAPWQSALGARVAARILDVHSGHASYPRPLRILG